MATFVEVKVGEIPLAGDMAKSILKYPVTSTFLRKRLPERRKIKYFP
jgi:hypothetical protein